MKERKGNESKEGRGRKKERQAGRQAGRKAGRTEGKKESDDGLKEE